MKYSRGAPSGTPSVDPTARENVLRSPYSKTAPFFFVNGQLVSPVMTDDLQYQSNEDPLRVYAAAVLYSTWQECERLGDLRRESLRTTRREWSKFSKTWGTLRRTVAFIWEDRFSWMVDMINQDVDDMRVRYLRRLAGVNDQDKKRCPKCGLVGPVDTHFGRRVVNDRLVAQSWCYSCRTGGG